MTAPESFRKTLAPDASHDSREPPVLANPPPPGKLRAPNASTYLLWLTLGFTLVELLIVIAIIGALAAIAIPNYYQHIEKAKMTKIISEMKVLETEINAYSIEEEEYPDSLADIGRAGFEDPWGNPYQYLNIPKTPGNGPKRKDHNQVPINSDFDLYSMGPDGKSASPLTSKNSYDDIIRGSNGAYFGPAWAY